MLSAFAYARDGDGAVLLVSASHCFTANPATKIFDATRLQLGWGVRIKYLLVNVTFPSNSAVLRCVDSAPLLARAPYPPVFAQAVVAAGYCSDAESVTAFSVHDKVSLHMLSSTVSVSMGPGEKVLATQGAPPPPPLVRLYSGGLQGKAIGGMSGGPVLNAQCSVLGASSVPAAKTLLLQAWMTWMRGCLALRRAFRQWRAALCLPSPPPPLGEGGRVCACVLLCAFCLSFLFSLFGLTFMPSFLVRSAPGSLALLCP